MKLQNAKVNKTRIKASFYLDTEFPEDYDKHDIEFYYNDSSYCLDNILQDIKEKSKTTGCCCSFCEVEVINIEE